MYKVILSVTVMITTLITLTSFAQEFSFKAPTITSPSATSTGSSNTIPTRSGVMSPESFKKSVSSTTQNRSDTVNNLAGQKLRNNPEYSIPISKTQKSPDQSTGMVEQPNLSKKPVSKPTQEPPTPPVQDYAPRDTYTGFSGQAPSGGSSPSNTNNNQNSSGGFGNIYQ